MKKAFTKTFLMSFVLLNVHYLQAQQTYKYSAGKTGYAIAKQDSKGLNVSFSISELTTESKTIDREAMQNVSIPGIFLPNEAGAPDLPSSMRYIAIPQGSKAVLKIVSASTEVIKNIDIAPAPVIPLDKIEDIGVPLVYKKDNSIYSKNALYPESPVMLSEQKQLRGIDVVELGITPFQYNPVTKDLIVYKDIQVEISFEGGNGHFGDDSYRSRWWDPILEDAIFNYNQLPVIDYNEQIQKAVTARATGCEYAIIVPNNPEFSQWADSIKKFRREQGILTDVFKLSTVGTTVAAIEAWVDNAYNTWNIKPAAILLLGDFGSDPNTTVATTTSPGFASDNQYSDVTKDNLPDIAFSRIAANNASQLQIMCSKFLDYERNPPVDPAFYDKPLAAIGWQDDRWYQLGIEIVTGFMKSINKHPVRVNNPSSPANNTGNNTAGAGNWSTTDATTIVKYFGDSGLKYIPDKPGSVAGGFTGGTATNINASINAGAFIAYHRDHGLYAGWHRPSYQSSNASSLTNVDNKLPFVFSINCNTGEYQTGSACFSETMHRRVYNGKNSGALGVIAPSEVSYSFVNDVFLWGIMDNMWPNFIPAMGTNPPARDMRPTFGSVSGQYFLAQSSWVGSGSKKVTYQLYHTFAEAFQWFYSEVPKNLTISHASNVAGTATSFAVTADAGSFIALTIPSPTGPIILGTATGTGASVNIPLAQAPTSNMLVTVTKQNYFRYGKTVTSGPTSVNDVVSNELNFTCYPNPFSQSTTLSYSLEKAGNVSLTVYDVLGKEVAVIMDNVSQSAGNHQVQFTGKDLTKGVYSCVLKADSKSVTNTVVIE